MKRLILNDEDIKKFIIENYKGVTPIKMTELVNDKFNIKSSFGQMKYFYDKNHLNSGLTGKFCNGHVSWNKGKKIENWVFSEEAINKMKNTWFKNGHEPWTGFPIGTERVKNGIIWIKVAKKQWVRKHIYIWEKEFGKLKRNEMIIFKDGNKLNCVIENLMLIDRNENLKLNQNKWRFKNQSLLQEIAVNTVKLKKETFSK